LKLPTVASKKYIKEYKKYKDYITPPLTPLIGCIYQAKTVDNLNIIGMLMECGNEKSTVRNKHGISYIVLNNTLKAVLAV
jgi:hypothetical protein